ncbi:hypothetical protein HYFRA_00000964 [Hymenoscyphus fraxineus]|uniref:lytic cellulose monooxygenase (C4-dehydrogenating) n=1 Tax=Hymenoscyphus fraxineus TaxID=746836 RepID=A0A9N9KRL2_9HELO|nr:hypothetical protein HYFRA_00000964 [Hymenoscyphus fraxineus]
MSFSTMKISAILALAASVAQVSAHGFVKSITIDGQEFPGFDVGQDPFKPVMPDKIAWTNTAGDIGFINGSDYAEPNIICHRDSKNAKLLAPIAAGGKITFQWTPWPDSHFGTITEHLADCKGDCTTVDKTSLEFFKISEAGLIDGTTKPQKWAATELIAQGNKWEITIPANVKPGQYVLRHEIIALFGAGNQLGAQHYPQCFNLDITGSGTELPAGTKATEFYKVDDPNILVDLNKSPVTYPVIPGGPLAFAAGGAAPGGGNKANGTSGVEAAKPPTTLATSARPKATPAPGTKSDDECPK